MGDHHCSHLGSQLSLGGGGVSVGLGQCPGSVPRPPGLPRKAWLVCFGFVTVVSVMYTLQGCTPQPLSPRTRSSRRSSLTCSRGSGLELGVHWAAPWCQPLNLRSRRAPRWLRGRASFLVLWPPLTSPALISPSWLSERCGGPWPGD